MTEIDFLQSRSLKNPIYLDLRSPGEYKQDGIPGAINMPVFDDSERAEIGDTYKNISKDEARFLGLRHVAPKLEGMLKKISRLAQDHSVVLYCWRGGMRSQSIYNVARFMHIPCYRLKEGYKDYRAYVNNYFARPLPFKVAVLHGLTGVGKTDLLKNMQENSLAQVVDLEGLSGNRGSVFGNVGLPPQPSQKSFESALWAVLDSFDQNKAIIVECESRRIGKILLPQTFFEAMQKGPGILAYASLPKRVERIIKEYAPQDNLNEILSALALLKKSLGADKASQLSQMAKTGDFAYLVEYLLVTYYDPLYKYPNEPDDRFVFCVECDAEAEAAMRLSKFLSGLGG